MMEDIEKRAAELQTRINSEIKSACHGRSALQWPAVAEEVIGRLIGDEWEYRRLDTFGAYPAVVFTQYRRAPREKRCPTCGKEVATIFEHLGEECG